MVYKPCDTRLSTGKGEGNRTTPLGKGKGKQSMPSSNTVGELDVEQDELVEGVCIGRIPVMVHSSHCHMHGLSKEDSLKKGQCFFDVGGYFIINGSEKVLIAQEEKVGGLRCIRLQNGKGFQARVPVPNKGLTLRTSHVMVNLRYQIVKEKGKGHRQRTPHITAKIPIVRGEVNVVIIFRDLGITTDEQLVDVLCIDLDDTETFDLIRPSLEAAETAMRPFLWDSVTKETSQSSADIRDAAFRVLESKMKSKIEETPATMLGRCLFPDLVQKDHMKAVHLGYMVAQVIAVSVGKRREDNNNECLSKKRLDLAGDLLLKESKVKLAKFRRELQMGLQKLLAKHGTIDVRKQIKPISFESAFSTGHWAHSPEQKAPRTGGIVVPLNRENPLATLSHLRQTELQADARGKLREARYPNMSYIGRFCLVQTPDGEKCGMVKSLALSSHITNGSPEKDVLEVLKQLSIIFLEDAPLSILKKMQKVFLNGQWTGVHAHRSLAKSMRLMRRTMNLQFELVGVSTLECDVAMRNQ